jgi:hypothetical protein
MYWVLGTGKLISNSGFFPCLLLSAERQALGPLVIVSFNNNKRKLLVFQTPRMDRSRYYRGCGASQLPLSQSVPLGFVSGAWLQQTRKIRTDRVFASKPTWGTTSLRNCAPRPHVQSMGYHIGRAGRALPPAILY